MKRLVRLLLVLAFLGVTGVWAYHRSLAIHHLQALEEEAAFLEYRLLWLDADVAEPPHDILFPRHA